MQIFSLLFIFSLSLFFPSVPFRQSSPLNSSSSSPAGKISIPGVHNAGKVFAHLFRGGQPHLSSLSELRKLGVTTIVDLRRESPHTRDQERARAESLGIHFVSIPVGGFSNPTSAQLVQFFTLLRESPPQTVFVHCEYGEDRTGVFIAAYRIAFDHWSPDQAISEMRAFGFHHTWHHSMLTFVRALPDRLQSDPVLKSALAN